jgi:hypothetical protein
VVDEVPSEVALARSRRDAISSIEVASEKELPVESHGVDPCQTPIAHAIVPPSLASDKEPTSRELLLDDRVERLLKENYLLLKERKELRETAQMRAESCNERLEQMREAKRLVRAALAETDKMAANAGTPRTPDAPALAELRAWAEKPI